ncbi:unnamed protein product [Oppiella nova]|uniref:Nuclear receptor domain-containing protein n=1 Tax=Oppiella nova TaxID=334625 RepID=A0A7R9LV39_9ACAR|nr:unnamed protein product [Oppiella nova]CAG2166609.1 unnamed protein product [Oppiella nova]
MRGYNYECITCCSCKVFFHRNHDNKALDHPVYYEKGNELKFINQGDTVLTMTREQVAATLS